MLKPAGCVIFILVMIAFFVICFKPATHAVEGYEAPNDSEYYALHIGELKTELEDNLFPLLEGIVDCEEADGQLRVFIKDASFADTAGSIAYYYDKELFIFEKV
ncbi:MAG: hypothetical protein Q4A83_03760 [Bacillota bacterium]|nr:hypothetical protein [Bacillota bacterium]